MKKKIVPRSGLQIDHAGQWKKIPCGCGDPQIRVGYNYNYYLNFLLLIDNYLLLYIIFRKQVSRH